MAFMGSCERESQALKVRMAGELGMAHAKTRKCMNGSRGDAETRRREGVWLVHAKTRRCMVGSREDAETRRREGVWLAHAKTRRGVDGSREDAEARRVVDGSREDAKEEGLPSRGIARQGIVQAEARRRKGYRKDAKHAKEGFSHEGAKNVNGVQRRRNAISQRCRRASSPPRL